MLSNKAKRTATSVSRASKRQKAKPPVASTQCTAKRKHKSDDVDNAADDIAEISSSPQATFQYLAARYAELSELDTKLQA